ncbi:unnamed protein product [Parajaminaea phylloscopi]
MTRYTKLDKRKAPHKATDYFAASEESAGGAQASEAHTPIAGSSSEVAASEEASTSATKRKRGEQSVSSKDVDDQTATDAESGTREGGSAETLESADPKKLHARVKLLRLKLKKAKTDERQKTLRAELKELSRAISTANGQRGGGAGADEGAGRPSKRRQPPGDGDAQAGSGEMNPWKKMEAERRAKSAAKNDVRREKRQQERAASTRCFACRSMGHAARDCPSGLNAASVALDSELEGQNDDKQVSTIAAGDAKATPPSAIVGRETVGICFRCGSTAHTLARCRRPAPRVGSDVPFATCFVCGQKGHLSSKCPQNASRGVYPNGGCCKLCQSVEHLAKDCPLRSSSATAATNATIASSRGGINGERALGADDDDFHAFARSKAEVDREEKQDRNRRQPARASDAKAAQPAASKPSKKVVTF